MAEKKKTTGTISKTARRSMQDDKNAQPKAIAWAWKRGVKIGKGRKPDAYLYNEKDVESFDPEQFIVIRANSKWVGSAPAPVRK